MEIQLNEWRAVNVKSEASFLASFLKKFSPT